MVVVINSTTAAVHCRDDKCTTALPRIRRLFKRSDIRTVRMTANSHQQQQQQSSLHAPVAPMRRKSDDDCGGLSLKERHLKHHQDQYHQDETSETIGCSFSSNNEPHNDQSSHTLVMLLQNMHVPTDHHQVHQNDNDDDDANVITLSENGNIKIQMKKKRQRVLPQPSTSFSDYSDHTTLSNNGYHSNE